MYGTSDGPDLSDAGGARYLPSSYSPSIVRGPSVPLRSPKRGHILYFRRSFVLSALFCRIIDCVLFLPGPSKTMHIEISLRHGSIRVFLPSGREMSANKTS